MGNHGIWVHPEEKGSLWTPSAALPHFYCLIYTPSHHVRGCLVEIQRGNKVFVRVEGFHASLVLEVPDTESLVISTAQNKLSPRMEQDATYPVIMAHKCHKAHASANVPHLNGLVSGSRQQKRPRLATLLSLWSCSFWYGGVGALRGPGNALYHMLVLSELSFAFLCRHHPHAHRLVVGAAGNQGAVLVGPHHAHPFSVPRESLHAVTVQETQHHPTAGAITPCTGLGKLRTPHLLSG